jgi:hypothetical protein
MVTSIGGVVAGVVLGATVVGVAGSGASALGLADDENAGEPDVAPGFGAVEVEVVL